MPKREKQTEEVVSQDEWLRMLREYVLPYLPDMLAKDVEAALGDGSTAQNARERLYNRLVGRPRDESPDRGRQPIHIHVSAVTAQQLAEAAQQAEAETVEGVVRLLPQPDTQQADST